MKIIPPSFIIEKIDGEFMLKKIETAGRTCYKSETNITNESSKIFIKKIIELGHESVLEHEKVSVRIVCDRSISHELIRHRIASYSQESTRYCNYGIKNEITVIEPCFWKTEKGHDPAKRMMWKEVMEKCEDAYIGLILIGAKPEEARSVLPNSLKTEIVMTCNLREWRHFFKLRTSKAAHPQMREIAIPMLAEFKRLIPVIFDDITPQ